MKPLKLTDILEKDLKAINQGLFNIFQLPTTFLLNKKEYENMFYALVDEEAVTKVFWTGATKFGCAGQFVDCFVEDGGMQQLDYEKRILIGDSGGSSVGVLLSSNKFTAKTMPGETKMYFACQSKKSRSFKVQKVYI